jgi:nucleoid-associated protein YgaU
MSNRVWIGVGLLLIVAVIAVFQFLPGSDTQKADNAPPPAASAPAPKVEAAKTPEPAPAAAPQSAPPSFDVVRVEPNGDLVVGGRAQSGSSVTLLADGKSIETAKVGETGQFAMVPPALSSGPHVLTLLMTLPDGKTVPSAQSVAVDVPQAKKGAVLVAKSEPGKATELLAPLNSDQNGELAVNKPTANGPRAMVGITVVEADETGALYVAGKAAGGSSVRLYLNESFVGSAETSADSSWSFRIEKGVVAGHYNVRVDDADPKTGKVLSRAEVGFDMPALSTPATTQPAAPSTNTAASTQAAPAKQAAVTIPAIETATVVRGDSLWRISSKTYGSGFRYTEIHQANREQIRDPDLIYPGQIFVLPKLQ